MKKPGKLATLLMSSLTAISSCISHERVDYPGYFTDRRIKNSFPFSFKGKRYNTSLALSEEGLKFCRARNHTRDYDIYASDPKDDNVIEIVNSKLEEIINQDPLLNRTDLPYLTIAFVQSLPYTSDKVTTGYDEYPRFPYETLADGGGDCEDTSILTAALLQNQGYDVVLLSPPGHMAVGIKGDHSIPGFFFWHRGNRYFYLETTGKGWKPGEIPRHYQNQPTKVIPIVVRAILELHVQSNTTIYTSGSQVKYFAKVINLGSKAAHNVSLYSALETTIQGLVWDQYRGKSYTLNADDFFISHGTLTAPPGRVFRLCTRVDSLEVPPIEIRGKWQP